MALALLPKTFEVFLKNFQKNEICALNAEGTHTNILVNFYFSNNVFHFSQRLYKWPLHHFPRHLKCFCKKSPKTWNLYPWFCAYKYKSFGKFLLLSQFLSFSQMVYKWPLQSFPGSSKCFLINLRKLEICTFHVEVQKSKKLWVFISLHCLVMFSNGVQMALTMLPKTFIVFFKILQKLESFTLTANGKNINNFVTFSFFPNVF